MQDYKRTIEVKMMGTLECRSEGKRLDFVYNTQTKMSQLMLFLLCSAHKGVSKHDILDSLYRDSDSDAANSLKTLFARLRGTLSKEFDLPGKECLSLRDGFYDIAPEIEILSDEENYKLLCKSGMDEVDPIRKKELLSEAISAYRGEILPMLSTEYWVIYENTMSANLFSNALRELCACLDEEKDYESAYKFYKRAQLLFPYNEEWIVGGINELLAMGNKRQALSEYEEITQTIFDDLGEYPSEQLLETLRKVSKSLSVSINTANVDSSEEEGEEKYGGAYYCTYPNFSGISHVLRCIMQRDGAPTSILIFTAEDKDGNPLNDKTETVSAISYLHIAVGKTLRATDLFCRYSAAKMLVMLWNTDTEKADIVIRRVESRFKKEDKDEKYKLSCEIFSGDSEIAPYQGKKEKTFRKWEPIPQKI